MPTTLFCVCACLPFSSTSTTQLVSWRLGLELKWIEKLIWMSRSSPPLWLHGWLDVTQDLIQDSGFIPDTYMVVLFMISVYVYQFMISWCFGLFLNLYLSAHLLQKALFWPYSPCFKTLRPVFLHCQLEITVLIIRVANISAYISINQICKGQKRSRIWLLTSVAT